MDGQQRSRCADRRVPTPSPVDFLDHLELLAGDVPRVVESDLLEPAIGEVRRGHRHAPHVETLHQVRLELAPEYEFGAAAADVHDQPNLRTVLHRFEGVGHAEIDQPRLLASADDLDAVTERPLGGVDEVLAVARLAQGVGADHAYVPRRQVADTLAEALEAGQRPGGDGWREAVVGGETLGETHRLLVPVHDLQTVTVIVGDDQVEAVGTEIEGGVGLVGVTGRSVWGERRHGR